MRNRNKMEANVSLRHDAEAAGRCVHFLNNGKVACGRPADFLSMDPVLLVQGLHINYETL